MSRSDLDLPPELAELVASQRQRSRAPEAARVRLHRRLAWAFTPSAKQGAIREAPRSLGSEGQRSPPSGFFARLFALRLATLPAALLSYLPLAVAGIGFGAASISVVHVLSRRPEPPVKLPTAPEHRSTRPQRGDLAGEVVPAIAPLGPLPAALPTPAPAVATPLPVTARVAPGPQVAGIPSTASAASQSPPPPAPLLKPAASAAPVAPPGGVLGGAPTSLAGRGGGEDPAAARTLERQLLEQARTALRSGAVAEAFAALDRHRALFPESQLSEERDVLAIEATARSSGLVVARPMAETFRQRYPRSPLLPALDAFLKSVPSQPNPKGVP